MTDDEMIEDGILAAEDEDRVIDDLTARIIANQWHGGMMSALYSLASTGAIRDDCESEINSNLSTVHAQFASPTVTEVALLPQLQALEALLAYVEHHGERDPLAGWSNLHW